MFRLKYLPRFAAILLAASLAVPTPSLGQAPPAPPRTTQGGPNTAQAPYVPVQPGPAAATRAAPSNDSFKKLIETPPPASAGAGLRGAEEESGPSADDVRRQAEGDFPALDRAVPLGEIQDAWSRADTKPAPGQEAPGISRYVYAPTTVYKIDTRVFMVTTVVLPAWETVAQVHLGDNFAFQVGRVDNPRQNILKISSKHAGGDTNMVVIGGSGRVYPFYIRSSGVKSRTPSDFVVYIEGRDPKADPPELPEEKAVGSTSSLTDSSSSAAGFLEKLASFAPASGAPSDKTAGKDDWLREIPFDINTLRFEEFRMAKGGASDSDKIAPDRVFHDGVFTFLYYGRDRMDVVHRPVVHLVIDGVDNPVNTRTAGRHGNILVVEAVGNLTLRNGARVVCIEYLGNIHRPVPDHADPVMPEKSKGSTATKEPAQGTTGQ